jgi:hypothetical protein
MRQAKRRFQDPNTVGRELFSNAAEQSVVFPAFELGQKSRAAQIGTKIAEQFHFANATRHYSFGYAGALKDADNFAKLADIDPGDLVGSFTDCLLGLAIMGSGDNAIAFAFRLLGEKQRELAIARN